MQREESAGRGSCLPAAPAAVRCGRRRSLCGVTAGRGGGDHRERQGGGVDAARARAAWAMEAAGGGEDCEELHPTTSRAHLPAFYGNKK